MNKRLKGKILEALTSVLPVTGIVLLMSVSIIPMPAGTLLLFLTGALLLILGMGLFSLGADIAMLPMGEGIGVEMTRMKKVGLALFACLIMGIVITIAEPDLQVLANQVPTIPNMTLILTVAVGVGVFLMIAMIRILLKINLAKLLIVFYILVFGLSILAPNDFIAVAFDSGGVTTGPITVPFIMALGIGMAMLRSDRDSQEDSFGLVALCSIGPILAVLLLGIFYRPDSASYADITVSQVETTRDVMACFAAGIPAYAREVLVAIFPILLLFGVFQLVTRRFHGQALGKVLVGIVYTYAGLVLFLTGVNVGFMPIGNLIGNQLANSGYALALIPIGALIGYFIVVAEPAVHVLIKQVEDLSNGAISQKSLLTCLSVGMAFSVGIAMIRVLFGVSIYWFLVPGYLIALVLSFFVPRIFTAIAFDSGGVSSGPMTATFLLPFAMGACEGVGGNILTDAFGIVAMVAMTPLISIQVLGFVYKKRMESERKLHKAQMDALAEAMLYYEG